MVDPIDQPRAGEIAQLMGQFCNDWISRGKRIDGARYPAGGGGLRFPDELVLLVGDGSFGVLHGSIPRAVGWRRNNATIQLYCEYRLSR